MYALLAGALRHGALGDRLRTGMTQLHEFVTMQVAAAGVTLDADRAAATLLALTDGLAAHVLVGYLTPDSALAALEAHLDVVFGPEQTSNASSYR